MSLDPPSQGDILEECVTDPICDRLDMVVERLNAIIKLIKFYAMDRVDEELDEHP